MEDQTDDISSDLEKGVSLETTENTEQPLEDKENDEESFSGSNFVDAVHEKYSGDVSADCVRMFVPRSRPVKITDTGKVILPRQVIMNGCMISHAGDSDLIKCMCPDVCELDLADNQFSGWQEVMSILECTPKLTFLNLTRNELSCASLELTSNPLPTLTHLVLNSTYVSWDVLMMLLRAFPRLHELHLSLNNYSTVQTPEPSWQHASLSRLLFTDNPIHDWSEVSKLGKLFPALEFMALSDTKIHTLCNVESIAENFPALRTLSLIRTCLGEWEDVEAIRGFPQLTEIRLRGIPLLESLPEKEGRQQCVALLPDISVLNGSPVSEEEREDAERAYIRKYMGQEDRPARYQELVNKHGQLDRLVEVDLTPKRTVNVTVHVERAEGFNIEQLKKEQMDISVNQTIKSLTKVLSNVAQHPASKLKLFYKDNTLEESGGFDRLIYPNREVRSYYMNDGDEIVVHCL